MARLDWYIRANLKLRHLQLLVSLDDYRNLSRVADLLNVTQSAVSKMLGEVQQGVGHKLFERTGRGLRPTEYGTVLIRHSRGLLQGLLEAGDELHAVAHGAGQRLRVGVQHAWASSLLPQTLELMKKSSPEAVIFVREATMDVLLHELRMSNLDAIVGTLPSRREAVNLEEEPLFEDDTVLVVRDTHPLLRNARVNWADVASYPWVMPPPDSLLRQPLLVAFGAHGIEPPNNYIETLSLNVALHYVQATDAIATMPASLGSTLQANGQIAVLELRLSRLMRPVGLIWRKSGQRSPAVDLLANCLREVVRLHHN